MIIGIPKEIKNNENRVGCTPAGVKELVKAGHEVYVQATAGLGSGFSDEEYVKAGASILPTIEDTYAKAEMIIKVKEPIEPEYALVRKGQVLFTYFHFACDRALLDAMLKSGAICIAYETVRGRDGRLPLLIPMSEVAGRMSVQEGARFLEKPQGGKGILLGGVPGVKPAKVLVLGAGVVGRNAALMAAGLGADVTICDISLETLRHCAEFMPKNVRTLYSSTHNIEEELPHTDLVIGSVLIPGAKAPHLITKDMVKLLKPGSVMVDVAIDQGGCFETSHPTTHSEPTYLVDDVIQYAVANIPGAVPFTSTLALTNATMPYALRLANMGWKEACKADAGLAEGVNVVDGKITYKAVAEAFDMPYTPLDI
ncbi:MAG: alanine dehydrogenase [Bacteroidales bacterium]|nr:alanine dehydrogenase [Bacteroidales bacterium]MBD5211664.1 alanine dehydrogenase [Bacteroidales bacterium]MBD5213185.1 alanine dehydrogenase [Bacteroidales bacterium]MBD5218315.1 alanine dehydrogenase [Bacteroidales bacterium]